MAKIPSFDITRQSDQLANKIMAKIGEVVASGCYIMGPEVREFEEEFAKYLHVDRVISCNSGTDALHLALRALDIKPGDEIITTPFTFIATTEAIAMVGATPVFVDIDPLTYNIDVNEIESKITPRTKVILPVHLYGRACNMTTIMAIAHKYNLKVVEDCAQAAGAKWDGQQVGTFGDIGCYSFFPTKNLGCFGDGGAIATNNQSLGDRLEYLRRHGGKVKYHHQEVGLNSRLDTIQASILQIKLPYLDSWLHARHEIAQYYISELSGTPGLILPEQLPAGTTSWNQFTVRVLNGQRNRCQDLLRAAGIGSMVYYPIPLHLQEVHGNLGYGKGAFPHSEQLSSEVLSLPMFPELTLDEQKIVVTTVKETMANLALVLA